MKKGYLVIGCVLLAALAGGCGEQKKKGATPAAGPQQQDKAASAPVAQRTLAQADPSVPLASYIRLDSGNQLMFMYHALASGAVDYEKIAGEMSSDYRRVDDGFKRQDMMAALKPRIDDGLAKAKAGRYFVYVYEVSLGSKVLEQYDFNAKSFPVDQSIWGPDAYSYFNDNARYHISYTNGEAFRELKVEDAEIARKIEALVTGYKPIKAIVHAFAQEASPGQHETGKVYAQIVKIKFTDGRGQDLLAK